MISLAWDITGERRLLEIDGMGCTLRAFCKPLGFPYGFHKWGVYHFGAGPIGFMFWPRTERAA